MGKYVAKLGVPPTGGITSSHAGTAKSDKQTLDLIMPKPLSGKSKAIQPDDTECFPFQKLPAELRNKIYKLCLVNEDKISPQALTNWHGFGVDPWRVTCRLGAHMTIGILGVNRQLYEEGSAILYGSNTFYFHDDDMVIKFFSILGGQAARLRSLEVRFGSVTTVGLTHLHFATDLDRVFVRAYGKKYTGLQSGEYAAVFVHYAWVWLCQLAAQKGGISNAVKILGLDEKECGSGSREKIQEFRRFVLDCYEFLEEDGGL